MFDYIRESEKLDFYEQDLSIIDNIEDICKSEEEFKLLQDDLKKLVIRHLYNTQCDGGNGHNIMLKTTPKGIRLAPLFDYEFAYVDYEDLHRYIWNIGELNITHEHTQNMFRTDYRFQELLHKLIDANISSFIAQIEDTHKILVPSEQKKHYKKYETKIKKLVLENKLIK